MTRNLPGRAVDVRRVTVDERLEPGLFRLMVARLWRRDAEIPIEDTRSWTRETPLLAEEQDLICIFGLDAAKPPAGNATGVDPAQFWQSLAEGQVYLVGEFRVVEDREGSPRAIAPDVGTHALLRIDRLEPVREHERRLYAEALRASDE